jgi:hypothetical protein
VAFGTTNKDATDHTAEAMVLGTTVVEYARSADDALRPIPMMRLTDRQRGRR